MVEDFTSTKLPTVTSLSKQEFGLIRAYGPTLQLVPISESSTIVFDLITVSLAITTFLNFTFD